MLPNFSLSGKVAIITGAKSGIGKAIALAYAESGADVVVSGRSTGLSELNDVSEQIKVLGRKSLVVAADVSRKAEVENLVQMTLGKFGKIDILVNNAGLVNRKPLLDLSEQEWDDLMDIDVKGCFLCSQAVGRVMVKQKSGCIINLASRLAFKARPEGGGYGVAKAGVVMLTKALAQELGPYNVRTNGIAPGLLKTEFSRPTWSDPERLKKSVTQIPLGRIAQPDDAVGLAVFLASEASSYINGDTILLDGGQNA